MLIKTLKPDLLVGATCHPEGAEIEVPDAIGRRLIGQSAAERVEARAPDEFETAMMRPARARATKRG